jgi:hypothetical protein
MVFNGKFSLENFVAKMIRLHKGKRIYCSGVRYHDIGTHEGYAAAADRLEMIMRGSGRHSEMGLSTGK